MMTIAGPSLHCPSNHTKSSPILDMICWRRIQILGSCRTK